MGKIGPRPGRTAPGKRAGRKISFSQERPRGGLFCLRFLQGIGWVCRYKRGPRRGPVRLRTGRGHAALRPHFLFGRQRVGEAPSAPFALPRMAKRGGRRGVCLHTCAGVQGALRLGFLVVSKRMPPRYAGASGRPTPKYSFSETPSASPPRTSGTSSRNAVASPFRTSPRSPPP